VGLREYQRKRHFDRTPEPGAKRPGKRGHSYCIQKHAATRLHYDLRLELDGVMKSWAVPKGPSLDPRDRRLAVEVEDHPVEYAKFEGWIPAGEYGAGQVIVWDRGSWEPVGDPHAGLAKGHLEFELHGERLHGRWMLVRTRGDDGNKTNWLLIKRTDEAADPGRDITAEETDSVVSGTRIEERPRGRGARRAAASSPAHASTRASAARAARTSNAAKPVARRARRTAPDAGTPGKLPARPAPELATLVKEPPAGADWLHEIKFDGYRLIARVEKGRARLLTRSGQDWTDRFATIAAAIERLPVRDAVFDGEVVVPGRDGVSSFQALQNALGNGGGHSLVYYVFDLLHLEGRDLTGETLIRRKTLLEPLVRDGGSEVRFSDHQEGRGADFFQAACRRGLEGIVSKRRDSTYQSTRTLDWVKTKCVRRQECVIAGFTEPEGRRRGIGALLLGIHDDAGKLVYCGKVGTGFSDATLADLHRRLSPLERDTAPFAVRPKVGGRPHWVEPKLVAEVAFTEWTGDGRLRHPSFQGLREDKPARTVKREREQTSPKTRTNGHRTTGARAKSGASAPAPARSSRRDDPVQVGPVRLTHPDRVLYADLGITKRDLAAYYEAVGEVMLPQVKDRPLMLKRCPEGADGPCFFQKHPGVSLPDALVPVHVKELKQTATWITVHDAPGLIGLVQVGVLESHVWGATYPRLEQPDRMVFDLDPGPEVAWRDVVETARRLHGLLDDLGLHAFLKTTGGKGLHVVVPLTGDDTWEDVRGFSDTLAGAFVRERPALYTTNIGRKAERTKKLLIDTLRNARGSTWVAPWSTRARPGAPVSAPIAWEELTTRLRPDRWNVGNVPARVARERDPWAGMIEVRQSLAAAVGDAGRPAAPSRRRTNRSTHGGQ